MEFRILGPLEVYSDGQALDLGGPKQRALLAMLLLHTNQVVSRNRLIDALWESDPPESAQKALQMYVSGLRKLLGRERLETKPPGYLLRIAEDELDLERFRQLREQGMLAEALALWRGPPLSNFADDGFAQAEIARLTDQRLACLEEQVDRELDAGRHGELTGELEALVAENPLREHLRGQLMLALYRSGRQAEALEAYQHARTSLVDELGIEPGRELRELHQAILNQDPALELARESEAMSVGVGVGFVGRESELAELSTGLDDAFAGRGRVFLLQGEPGIGKSRLADELSIQAVTRGATVLVGRCWEVGGAPAYWPWTQCLRAYIRQAEPAAVQRQLGGGAAEVAQIVPELHELIAELPAPGPPESEAARFRMFDSTASFLRKAATDRPIVLVLDDLHEADEPSLLLLRYVASGLGDSRILVVGTFRDLDPTLRDPLESTLVELGRESVIRRIRLTGLSESEVERLAELTAETVPSKGLVAGLHAETEGNPLFVSEIVRLLAAEDQLHADQAAGIPLPETIKEVIGRRVRRLSDECQRLLLLASVLGREFAVVALEQVADYTDIEQLLAVLDEAITARVVEEVRGMVGRLRFGHALTRDVLYEDIPVTHRARLHRRAGEVLEGLYGENSDQHLAEFAHHFSMAVPAVPPEKAVEYATRAGDEGARFLAYEEAARLYASALDIAQSHGSRDDTARCELTLRLGDVQARSGDVPAAKESFLRAAEIARAAPMPDQLARAALGYGGRFVWARAWGDSRLIPLLEEALDTLPSEDSELRVRLMARLAGGPLRDTTPREVRVAMSEKAVGMARRLGNVATLAYALNGRYSADWGPDVLAERLAIADELIQAAKAAGDLERTYEGHDCRFEALLEAGELHKAREVQEVKRRLAYKLRQPAQQWDLAICDVNLALLQGKFDEAEGLIERALGIGALVASSNATVGFKLQLYGLRREQGRLGEIVDMLRQAADDYEPYPVFRYVLADVYAELDRKDDTRALLDLLAADGFPVYLEMQWLFSLSLMPEVCRYLDDRERAGALYDRLLPYAQHNAVSPPELCRGSVSRGLGILAATTGRTDEAERHFRNAFEMNQRMGARPWLAHTQEDCARMMLARGDAGDAEGAARLLDEASATYRELGMAGPLAKTGSAKM